MTQAHNEKTIQLASCRPEQFDAIGQQIVTALQARLPNLADQSGIGIKVHDAEGALQISAINLNCPPERLMTDNDARIKAALGVPRSAGGDILPDDMIQYLGSFPAKTFMQTVRPGGVAGDTAITPGEALRRRRQDAILIG